MIQDFWTIYLSVLAAEASYELLKWVAKAAFRPKVRRDARGRFAAARPK